MTRGVTSEQIHQAADELLQAGERPTIERIRAALGTGSPATVNKHLDTWWRGLGPRLASRQALLELPDAPAEVASAAAKLWTLAIRHAESTMDTRRAQVLAEADVVRSRAEAFEASLLERARALDARETGQRELIDRQKDELQHARATQVDLQGQLQSLASQHAEVTSRLEVAQLEREQLREALALVTAERDREAAAGDAARQQAQQLTTDLAAANTHLRDQRSRVNELKRELASAQGRLQALQQTTAEKQARISELDAQLDAQARQTAAAAADRDEWRARAEVVMVDLRAARDEGNDKEQARRDAEHRCDLAERQAAQLATELERVRIELAELRQQQQHELTSLVDSLKAMRPPRLSKSPRK